MVRLGPYTIGLLALAVAHHSSAQNTTNSNTDRSLRYITSAHLVNRTECGAQLAAGGRKFYIITLPAASTMPDACKLWITNTDPMPTGWNATGAKVVSGVNCDPANSGTYVWPLQTMEVTTIAGTWMATRCPGLWELPRGTFTLNFDPINGSDQWGAADGLSTSGRAFKSASNALNMAAELIRQNFHNQTRLNIKCTYNGGTCLGQSDNHRIHWSTRGAPAGSQGGKAIVIDCNGGMLTGSYPTISTAFGSAALQLWNCVVQKGVDASWGSMVVIGANDTFVPIKDNYLFRVLAGGRIFCASGANGLYSYNLAGGTGGGLMSIVGGVVNGCPVNLLGNVIWTSPQVSVGGAGLAAPATGAWTLNGHTVTGSKYQLVECGILEGAANLPGTVPGSASCRQAN
jgi:hypothetical protein